LYDAPDTLAPRAPTRLDENTNSKKTPVLSAAESAQFKTARNGIGIFQQDAGNGIVVQIDASNPRVSGYITADRKGARVADVAMCHLKRSVVVRCLFP